jgi:hypothetical protein
MGDAEQGPLTFDKATYEEPSSPATPCSSCKGPLGDPYWKLGPYVLCEKCRGSVAATFSKTKTASAFGKAALLGGLTAFGCGVLYAIFAGITKMQLALVTIGIAYVVATVVRRASGGFSGRRFQVLAVTLTYFASTMGYLPSIFAGMTEAATEHRTSNAAAASDTKDKPAQQPADHHRLTAGDFVKVFAFLLAIMLAAPFLELTSAPIGFLIVVFGLWEAWRRARAVPLALEGPFRVST